MTDIAVAYWLDLRPGAKRYQTMCLNSLRTLREVDTEVPVWIVSPAEIPDVYQGLDVRFQVVPDSVHEAVPELEPRYGKYSLLDADFGGARHVVVLDVDTFVNAPIAEAFPADSRTAFAARLETGTPEDFAKVNRKMGWVGIQLAANPKWSGPLPFNTGAYMLETAKAGALMEALLEHLGKPCEIPFVFEDRPSLIRVSEYFQPSVIDGIREEVMFRDAVFQAGLETTVLGSRTHGFYWHDDPIDAPIFHTGSAYYEMALKERRAAEARR